MTPVHADEVDRAIEADVDHRGKGVAQEAGKTRLVHLAGGHRKLAMLDLAGSTDMAVDLYVVGRIGKDGAGALVTHIAFCEPCEHRLK